MCKKWKTNVKKKKKQNGTQRFLFHVERNWKKRNGSYLTLSKNANCVPKLKREPDPYRYVFQCVNGKMEKTTKDIGFIVLSVYSNSTKCSLFLFFIVQIVDKNGNHAKWIDCNVKSILHWKESETNDVTWKFQKRILPSTICVSCVSFTFFTPTSGQ